MTHGGKGVVVIGLGITGLSCAQHLSAKGVEFMVADTRFEPSLLPQLREQLPDVPVLLGPLDGEKLSTVELLIMSPGISIEEPAIQQARMAGVAICSDIDLFCSEVSAPVIAITGSNAKSTVTTLVGEMACRAGVNVGVGGNIGTPVLDLLEQGPHQLYVLELSSFQLEITHRLQAEVAVILNVSADHLDRHAGMADYLAAKQKIFSGCHQVIENRDDPQTNYTNGGTFKKYSFGLSIPTEGEFGLIRNGEQEYLATAGQCLMPVCELKIKGRQNISNALAALAIGNAVGLPMQVMLDVLREFEGLPHRCQWVASKEGVTFYNDSKGTNPGATIAALEGLGQNLEGRVVLIAGGEGKGADFSGLADPVGTYCRAVILIGRDAPAIGEVVATQLDDPRAICKVGSMQQAVLEAFRHARSGDVVLLSPACASFDMFSGFEARGDAFIRAVGRL